MRQALSETVTTPEPVRPRRPRRLCIDAHSEFVATLVAELQSSVARLQSASRRLLDGAAGDSGVGLDRETKDIARLVDLLDAIDGPGTQRRLAPLSLAETIAAAARGVDVAVAMSGRAGDELFVADGASVRTALELLLLALAGDGTDGPVRIRIHTDREVALEGTMDLSDPRRSWQLRSGRRVLEGEGFRVRLPAGDPRYRVELSVGR